MLALLIAGLCWQGTVPRPERDMELSLVLKTPVRTHPWWPIVVEVWVENRSTSTVPIVREMDGSWEGWVEPFLAWRGTVTTADGKSNPIPTGAHAARCGNYASNWVAGILAVPPGERLRLFDKDIHDLFRTATWQHPWNLQGSVELRLEYEYRAQPSRPSQWEPTPAAEELRFGAFSGVAPFKMTSGPVVLELLPCPVSAEELERDLVLEVEIENGGRFFAWEPLRGRARLRNVSTRTHPVLHPERGARIGFTLASRLDYPHGWMGAPPYGPDLAPGEALEIPLESVFLRLTCIKPSELWVTGSHSLRLVYVWDGDPVIQDYERIDLPAGYGPMADVPPFMLLSSEVQIEVVNPLVVELVPRAPVPLDRRYRLSEVLALVLRNAGEESLELASTEAPLGIDLCAPDGWCHSFEIARPLVLPPHAELELTSDPDLGIDAWRVDESVGVQPRNRGEASVRRKGWSGSVQSRQVAFELR